MSNNADLVKHKSSTKEEKSTTVKDLMTRASFIKRMQEENKLIGNQTFKQKDFDYLTLRKEDN